MPLLEFNQLGDLPAGVHLATLDEVLGFVIGESVDEFIAHWQITRDRTQRGIGEIVQDGRK